MSLGLLKPTESRVVLVVPHRRKLVVVVSRDPRLARSIVDSAFLE